ncbi:MAG TPA: isoprenylcysteine carboxylmethyltransferase family protein [Gemmatimonadaceae bacterium]|nr:isoprenylcysteine carboxylmethyltransferase family protein [Gemmatimonadaceae bacterium]
MNLRAKAWFSLAALAMVSGLLIFVLAGTIRYWEAWVYLAVFLGASFVITIDLMHRDPALLERRMSGGPTAEKRPIQQIIMTVASAAFLATMVVPALDRRFGWSHVPVVFVLLGDALVALGYYFVYLVSKENTFMSATIELAKDQRVISTGPYAIVRHPMYAGAMLYVLGTPLALGSYWGLLAVAVMLACIIWRLLDEERFLATSLAGYAEYQRKVQRRLVPFVW